VATEKTSEQISERKRISIPKADESALEWWDAQSNPGESIRLLIRAEIQRTGYADYAYQRIDRPNEL
jgi:hypothetical protein